MSRLGKALLVEDEALVAMVSEDILAELGFEPVSVQTAAEAVAALSTSGFSLALVDVGLPDMRGDRLAERLREIAPDLPIVIASGYDPTELIKKFAPDKAVTVLAKPYQEIDLRQACAELGLEPV